ncbi:Ser-Thr-rich glycosyl-phosphatidyl-inositol-anchored membrane family-domain-containing protein [Podospora australis]|uniref:Ser-Thr-rich glycosyl-phosphatidyl-inositol-anchored membrane family-domain-containing protein n=1 Tax=Podospora australis TaxID=1536484 RepID=A0AAN7APT8_9PEZI|nr:Ser-Thr-rich glycosyl-phosphatidyl-inositol-anchored membrane family-domain-containing protein [Podospora australis]
MRVLSFIGAIAAIPSLVSAIHFIEPTSNSTLRKGDTYTVKWGSVDTDPGLFSLYLVNFVNWPPFYTQLAADVSTESGEYEVTIPCAVDASWGYQFNAINGTNVYVIHAQTPKFYVRNGFCSGENLDIPSIPVVTDTLQQPTCEAVTVTATATAAAITAEPTCDSEPITVTATVTSTVTISEGSVVLEPSTTCTDGIAAEESGSLVKEVPSPAPAPETEEPAQPITTPKPTVLQFNPHTESVIKVYSTKYIDLSEVTDGSCVC